MFSSFTAMLSHTFAYLTENLTCLTYGFEILLHKYLINFACYDLLVDISESFGVWVTLFVLVASALLTSVVVHKHSQVTKSANTSASEQAKPSDLKAFLKFSTLPKTKL